MKGVEAFKILYVTAKLWDGSMSNETLVICVNAKLRDSAGKGGARSSERDETPLMSVTAKRRMMTSALASGFVQQAAVRGQCVYMLATLI